VFWPNLPRGCRVRQMAGIRTDDSRFVRHICAWAGHDTDGKQVRRISDYLVCLT
jgi:hypothetical protein